MSLPISQEANDLIIASEVGSKAQYEKKYRHPEWPGGASGVTVGIGYDLGYASDAKVLADWGNRLPAPMVNAMRGCVGITGDAARVKTAQVKSAIDVPWAVGVAVYENTDIPEWTNRVTAAIPGANKLHPHCLGALVSLAYNRGASFKMAGDRYKEMRAIRSHIMAGELSLVDDEIRAMKRLWPASLSGLWIRRDKEAALWNKGLAAAPVIAAQPPQVKEEPTPLADAKPAGAPEAATTMAGAMGTAGTAQTAAAAGVNPWLIAAVVVGGLVLTAVIVGYVRYKRGQDVVARQKG